MTTQQTLSRRERFCRLYDFNTNEEESPCLGN